MESNNNDNYVLVLEDRTEVKNEKEMGKLSVVSGIDDKGMPGLSGVGMSFGADRIYDVLNALDLFPKEKCLWCNSTYVC